MQPYRSESESLRAENERLHRELARRARGGRPQIRWAFAFVGGEVVAILLLRPWLNGTSDVRFWAALAILGGIAISAALAAFGRASGN